MSVVFWVLSGLVVYVYAGYPLMLHVWARLARRKTHGTGRQYEPSVSIVIAARNEARRVPGRLENLRQLDYPNGKQQVIVVSDGSTDDTVEVLARTPRVIAVDVPAGGKARALN